MEHYGIIGWIVIGLLVVTTTVVAIFVKEPVAPPAPRARGGIGDYWRLVSNPTSLRLVLGDLFFTLGPGLTGPIYLFFFNQAKGFTISGATVLAINDELNEGGFILRYRVHETDDGLEGEEGTFLICSFWMVSALSEIGEADRARQLCERLLAHSSSLGLYAEELEAKTGRHLGNFPQAFTHLALINAVMHIISQEEAAA